MVRGFADGFKASYSVKVSLLGNWLRRENFLSSIEIQGSKSRKQATACYRNPWHEGLGTPSAVDELNKYMLKRKEKRGNTHAMLYE